MKNFSIVPRTSVLFAQFDILRNPSKTLTIGIMALNILFFRSALTEHSKNYVNLPAGVEHDHKSIEYLQWAKNRNKIERDAYLSLSCILAQMFLVTVSHWI